MSDIFILDDRPDDDPEVIERRKKLVSEIPKELRELIEREAAIIIAKRNENKKD